MAYKKAKPNLFNSMMTLGNFALEGSSSYMSRRVVICVPVDDSKISSCIPLSFMNVVETASENIVVGIKRKSGDRGPGKKDFISLRSPAVASHSLTNNLLNTIEEFLKLNKNKNNIKLIVQSVIMSIAKSYEIIFEKMNQIMRLLSQQKNIWRV